MLLYDAAAQLSVLNFDFDPLPWSAEKAIYIFRAIRSGRGRLLTHRFHPVRFTLWAEIHLRFPFRHAMSPSVMAVSHFLWRTHLKRRSVLMTAISMGPPQI